MVRKLIRVSTIPAMLALCSLFYYFGELIDWAAWDAIRRDFFYGIHDVHRLLFLVPIVFAACTARIRGAVIVTLISFVIFLPRAFFISPFPDPLLRMCLFTIFAGTIGVLVGWARNECECRKILEQRLTQQTGLMPPEQQRRENAAGTGHGN